MPPMISVTVVDDHPVVHEGVASYFSRATADVRVLVRAGNVVDSLRAEAATDLALVDLLLDDDSAVADIEKLRERGSRVLVYTAEDRVVPLRRAVEAGAEGVVSKSEAMSALLKAVRDVMRGEFFCSGMLAHALLDDGPVVPELSERQIQVLQALHEGLDYRAVARKLGISEGVVKTHLARIREKYRNHGIEPGNLHHLTRLAAADGYLKRGS